MRRRLVTAGRWRATVEVQEKYDPGSARVDLTFAVTSGAFTQLEFVGTPVSRSLHQAVQDIVRDGGARGDALEAGGGRIEYAFRRQGHPDVLVRSRFEKRAWGDALGYEVRAGPAATSASVPTLGSGEAPPLPEARQGPPLREP